MWKRGRAYLQLGWDPDGEPPTTLAVIGNIIGCLAFFYGSAFAVTLLLSIAPVDMSRHAGKWSTSAAVLVFASTALGFAPVLIHLRRSFKYSVVDVFFGKSRNPLWLLAGISLTWAVMILGQIAVGREFRWTSPNAGQIILFAPLLLAILFQSAAEELVFRGYFSKAVYLLGRGLLPVFIIVPIAFFAYHTKFNLTAFIYYAGVGLFYSYLTLRTGSLQMSTGAHFANNGFAVLAGNWIVNIHPANIVVLSIVEMAVMALIVELALRLSKLGRADNAGLAGEGY